MAQTLASGVVIPEPGDRISAAGVQEIRTLGASVDTGLTLAQAQTAQVDAQSRARDADLADQVAGMEGMTYVGAWESGRAYRINDVVTHGGGSWARLTAGDAGEPGTSPADWGLVARKGDGGGFGELSETDVAGLWEGVDTGIEARLDALERDTGTLTVTSTFPEVTNGDIWIRRVGKTVYATLYDVEFATSDPPEFFYLAGSLPVGYRPAVNTSFAALADINGTVTRRIRFQANGQILLYDITASSRINATVSYLTPDPWPAP